MVIDNFYYLYRFRKSHHKYPYDYISIHINAEHTWLIIGRYLENEEVNLYDLELHGERLTYKDLQAVIKKRSH